MVDAAGKTILIVEDDPDAADALQILLEDEGYGTVLASDAQTGLATARAKKPSLILLDVMMPSGTEGFHFVWDLRKDPDPAVRDLPIIVLTAIQSATGLKLHPEKSDKDYGPYEYLPVQAFLDKAASSAELIGTIERVLQSPTQLHSGPASK
jgi:CheY-like chemotaxis protein